MLWFNTIQYWRPVFDSDPHPLICECFQKLWQTSTPLHSQEPRVFALMNESERRRSKVLSRLALPLRVTLARQRANPRVPGNRATWKPRKQSPQIQPCLPLVLLLVSYTPVTFGRTQGDLRLLFAMRTSLSKLGCILLGLFRRFLFRYKNNRKDRIAIPKRTDFLLFWKQNSWRYKN